MLRPPSFGPGEAAPFQKLYEEKEECTQLRTGPSLCLVESGWKSTCKRKKGRGGRVQIFENTKSIKYGFCLGRKSSKKSVPECSRAGVCKLQPRNQI